MEEEVFKIMITRERYMAITSQDISVEDWNDKICDMGNEVLSSFENDVALGLMDVEV